MNQAYLRGIYLRLAGVVALVVTLALAANALLSHRIFEAALAPQRAAKVAGVGSSVRALVQRAVESGIEFDQLYGVKELFDAADNDMPELAYLSITDTRGRVMHRSAGDRFLG